MSGKQIPFFKALCLLLLLYIPAFAQSTADFAGGTTITLGGDAGWPAFSRSEGITTGTGRFGYTAIVLDTDASVLTPQTDLLISFEEKQPRDLAGNYTVTSSALIPGQQAVMGKGAALSMGNNTGMRLMGKSGSIFGSPGDPGSFSIEFWLKPSISDNGEQLFAWHSSANRNNQPVYQYILASIFSNKIEWKFTNVFRPHDDSTTEIVLSGYSNLIPEQWAHHSLTFDEESGMLEYRINGKTEAVVYCTSTGREHGDIYSASLGVPAEIEICPQFTGLIDDFLILRGKAPVKKNYDKYPQTPGRFESLPLSAGSRRAELKKVDALIQTPGNTDVNLFVRAGENFYRWTDSSPEWIPVAPGEKLSGIEGSYFQVAAELYSDGEGKMTPAVTSITLTCAEDLPPLPPSRISAVPGDGSAALSWSASVDFDTAGYLVYYGERPGEYMGTAAALGPSPINAGNALSMQLNGLTNGKIYYFAVAAYDELPPLYPGDLSQEVSARPLRKRND